MGLKQLLSGLWSGYNVTHPGEPFIPDDTPSHEPPKGLSQEELIAKVSSYPYWYQRIYLGQNVYTISDRRPLHDFIWPVIRGSLPISLEGRSILDVGTNAGFYPIQASLMGASRVVGIESMPEYLDQARFCRQIWDLDIEYLQLDAHDLKEVDETFDIVIFAALLYHLKNPLAALEDVAAICSDAMIFESEIIPPNPRNRLFLHTGSGRNLRYAKHQEGFMKFIERDELNDDGSNWWVPDVACVLGMLRTAGFTNFSKVLFPRRGRVLLIATKHPQTLCQFELFDRYGQ